MKTTEEIVAKMKLESERILDFQAEVLANYVPFGPVKSAGLLSPEANEEDWEWKEPTRENVITEMAAYMAFAWGKVLDHRGISAGRSVNKMQAWLWLLEDEATGEGSYPNYGAPILKRICEKYGLPIPDDPRIARMAQGRSCVDGCEEGCGR